MSCNSDNDLEDLLEKSIDEKYSKNNKTNKCPFTSNVKNWPRYTNKVYKSINKVEEKVKFNSLLLPEGWVRIFHESGMYFYCHVSTKVVTWSMPYQLQTEPARYHRVPVRSIPCLSSKFFQTEDEISLNLDNSDKKCEKSNADGENVVQSPTLMDQQGADEKVVLPDPVSDAIDENIDQNYICNNSISFTNETSTVKANGNSDADIVKNEMEEGELGSSDDEGDNGKSKEIFLPKQYQIGDTEASHNKPKRLKANSMNEVTKSTLGPVVPVKRRKICSDIATGIPSTNETTKEHVFIGNTGLCAIPSSQVSESDDKNEIDATDFSVKLLEPKQLKAYCSKRFTFVEEARFVPRFYFFKRKQNKTAFIDNKNNLNSNNNPSTTNNISTTNNSNNSESNNQIDKPKSMPMVTNSNLETKVSLNCKEKLKIPNKNIFIDLAGRNFSCILNMYCQNAFGGSPIFKASSSLSGIHDFQVSSEIGGVAYAIGEGRTKKIAKQRAVIKTLEILIPGFLSKVMECDGNGQEHDNYSGGPSGSASIVGTLSSTSSSCPSSMFQSSSLVGTGGGLGSVPNYASPNRMDREIYSIFDNMDITDPRVLNYSTKLNSMTPYNVLIECMNRHCVLDSHLVSTICKQNKHNVYRLKLGDKEVQANCENKREGRQLASQYMLAKLHPHIQRWGGILRLYGPDSKPIKRFDMQEMQNLLLEDRGGVKNNLINLLRKKMLELNEEWQTTNKTHAKFRVPFENVPIIVFHPDSNKDQSK